MKIIKNESITGILFAVIVAIFINYSSIERIIEVDRTIEYRVVVPLVFSIVWHFFVSMLCYFIYTLIFRLMQEKNRRMVMIIGLSVGLLVVTYLLTRLFPDVRDMILMRDQMPHHPREFRLMEMPRGFNPTSFHHLLVLILNLLFVYIQRLLYRNQEIERDNQQLQMESIKSQHNALLQQINPHFFFNSLGSLRYIILKGESETAVEFLDNLTAIFRKTLKLSQSRLHSLSEEMEITDSYLHIIGKRFEGKIFVEIDIDVAYLDYQIPPLSLLTLIENVVKHNKIGVNVPITVKLYTTKEGMIVVENNIVPKFDAVESNGIGLKNLNKQYELLIGRGIEITTNATTFKVRLPLINNLGNLSSVKQLLPYS
ncbi:MAG: histidine kinase [Rikenellaceae bacterium]